MGGRQSPVSTIIGESVAGATAYKTVWSGKASAVSGMVCLFSNTIACRLIGFAGQLALGWLLLPNEFGLYAFALSIAMAVGAIRNGGVGQLLIQQGDRYAELAGPVTIYATVFNLLAMGILMAIALCTSRFQLSTELPWMLVCIALSFPLGTLGVIFRSKLSIDRRFGAIAWLNFSSTLVWQASVVGLAFLGFGPFSFVVPLVLQSLYESIAGWFSVREFPAGLPNVNIACLRQLFRDTRWIMASAAALSFAVTGDYFIVGLLSDRETVGQYFFSFQLVVTLAQLFSNGIETVFPPLLRSLNHDLPRQSDAFCKSLRALLLAAVPVSLAFVYLAPLLIGFLWQGKWDGSAKAVQFLATCIPAWVVITTFRTLLEARGLWRARFLMLTVYGVGGMTSAGLGAAVGGGVTEIAISVSGYFVLFAGGLALVGPMVFNIPRGKIVPAVSWPVLISCGCAIASSTTASILFPQTSSAMSTLVPLWIFLSLVLLANIIFYRAAWKEVLDNVSHSVRGRIADGRK